MTDEAEGQREEQRDKLREEPAPGDDVVVVRGGPDTVAKLRTHARRTHRAWCVDGVPLFGVSVFCALDDVGVASLRGILAGRLVTHRLVHTTTVSDLHGAGFELLPTGRRPHFTVALASDEDAELERLFACLEQPQDNRYYLASRWGSRRRT